MGTGQYSFDKPIGKKQEDKIVHPAQTHDGVWNGIYRAGQIKQSEEQRPVAFQPKHNRTVLLRTLLLLDTLRYQVSPDKSNKVEQQ